jgi:hypothetical protein
LLNEEFTAIGCRGLRARGFAWLAESYTNPDKNPDLPFIWRAAEWVKNDGIIALALPARIFSRTTGKGYEAWRAVFRSIYLTGLINGSDLRKTAVWESMDVPFCLLFARNAVPPEGHRFNYASPLYEPSQNRYARFRIDYETTRSVGIERVEKQPWVLKALSLGTWRDVEVIEGVQCAFPQTLAEWWKVWDPKGDKTGKGYDRSQGLAQKSADFLGRLLDFEPPESGFSIQFDKLTTYVDKYGILEKDGLKRATAYWPKTETLYQPPLVIIPKAPGENPRASKAFIASRAVAFSQSYYGYSCAEHPDANTLAALLFIIAHSSLLRYFVLMISVTQGADRMLFTKQDLDALPFPDVSSLSGSQKRLIRTLARKLAGNLRNSWNDIDSYLFHLYGLDEDARQVAQDTLFAAAAYRRQGQVALQQTSREHRVTFCNEISEMLEPYFDVCGESVLVEEPKSQPNFWEQPWFFLAISRAQEPVPVDARLLRIAMEEANRSSASRIMVRAPGGHGLLLGLLNQRRWWTITRARLCGQHIIRHHLEAFGLSPKA